MGSKKSWKNIGNSWKQMCLKNLGKILESIGRFLIFVQEILEKILEIQNVSKKYWKNLGNSWKQMCLENLGKNLGKSWKNLGKSWKNSANNFGTKKNDNFRKKN